MQNEIVINVGSLKSLNKLYLNISQDIEKIRKSVTRKEQPNIVWDFRFVEPRRMSMAALTAFLSIAKNISDYFKKPSFVKFRWDPYVLTFLNDISFFNIAGNNDILTWDERMVGGFESGKTNPFSKIVCYYEDTSNINYKDVNYLNTWKEEKREYIRNLIIDNFTGIFRHNIFTDRWNEHLRDFLCDITAELAVNSILHGKDMAFIGMQRAPKRATVCVCDGGLGFLNSMKKSNEWVNHVGLNRNIDAILNASLMKIDDIGLRSAIDDVISSDGWVILSSYDCEIKWAYTNWQQSKTLFNYDKYKEEAQRALILLGDPLTNYVPKNIFDEGYYKLYIKKLVGSRITFEIPMKD